MDTEKLEVLDLLHYSTVDEDGGVHSLPYPVVHDHLNVEGEVVVLAPHCQVSDLLPVGCLIVNGDQAYHCCAVCKLNDGVGGVRSHGVLGLQGVQEGTKPAPLRGPSIEAQRGGCIVAYPYHMGVTGQEDKDPVAEGGV